MTKISYQNRSNYGGMRTILIMITTKFNYLPIRCRVKNYYLLIITIKILTLILKITDMIRVFINTLLSIEMT